MGDTKNVKKLYKNRDRVIRAISADGHFRIAALHNTKTVQSAQQRHKMGMLASVLLGRLLSGATLLSSLLKMEERIILQAEGNGLIKKMYAESNAVGEVRGFVQNPQATLNFSDGNSSLSDGLGLGLLQVSRVLYNRNEPVTGVVELIKSDISTDLAYYLTQSEQIPSAVLLDVSVDENGLVEESGGLLVQAMPGASVEEIQSIQDSIRSLKSLTALFKSGYSPDEVIKIVLGDTPEELKSTPVDFFCRCSMKRFKQQLITLPKEEIEGMQAEGQNELVCQYCNEKYLLSDDDFREILAEKMAASN